eukprot:6196890-Pleurochrysis_carterae.AAC.1
MKAHTTKGHASLALTCLPSLHAKQAGMHNKLFNSKTTQKDYCRILSQDWRRSFQSRRQSTYTFHTIHTSMEIMLLHTAVDTPNLTRDHSIRAATSNNDTPERLFTT